VQQIISLVLAHNQEDTAQMTEPNQASFDPHSTKALDRQSLAEAYERYQSELFRYAYRFLGDTGLAEDCVSETFCRLLKAIRDGLGPVENLRAYLYRVAHNWVTDYFRGQPQRQVPLDAELHGEPEANPSQLVGELLEREHVRAALLQLPPDQQQVLVLRFVEDLSHEEVAAIMERSVQATRTLQHRAVVSLRQLLTLEESGITSPQPGSQKSPPVSTPARSISPRRQTGYGWPTTGPITGR
jgi:RNA polymerase sigma-70 factor, ECF subfamily